jgi:hypothetical protein
MTTNDPNRLFRRMHEPEVVKVTRATLLDPWAFAMKSNSEDAHQTALFMWANKAELYGFNCADDLQSYYSREHCMTFYPNPVHELRVMFAVPNGGLRNVVTAMKLKATGTKAGIPDVVLAAARGGYHGLFIELKRPDVVEPDGTKRRRGVVSNKQITLTNELRVQGYCVAHCIGWLNAVDAVKSYLAMRTT